MLTRDEVERAIADVAVRLPDVRPTDIPDFVNRDGGYPFLAIEDRTFVYGAYERGREVYRRETTDVDELLWLVFPRRHSGAGHQADPANRSED